MVNRPLADVGYLSYIRDVGGVESLLGKDTPSRIENLLSAFSANFCTLDLRSWGNLQVSFIID